MIILFIIYTFGSPIRSGMTVIVGGTVIVRGGRLLSGGTVIVEDDLIPKRRRLSCL